MGAAVAVRIKRLLVIHIEIQEEVALEIPMMEAAIAKVTPAVEEGGIYLHPVPPPGLPRTIQGLALVVVLDDTNLVDLMGRSFQLHFVVEGHIKYKQIYLALEEVVVEEEAREVLVAQGIQGHQQHLLLIIV